MNALLKTVLFGGIGIAGLAGVGAFGWSLYDSSFPTVSSLLFKRGYSFEPAKGPDDSHNPKTGNRFKWQSWDCVKRMFPGVQIKTDAEDNSNSSSSASANSVELSEGSKSNSGKPVGCALVEMHPWKDADNISRPYLRSEIALKNDKVGFVVWSGWVFGRYSSDSDKSTTNTKGSSFDCVYKVILLEKEGGNWTVKGGYEWEDSGSTSTFTATVYSVIVRVPSEVWFDNIKFSEAKTMGKKSWFGVWEQVGDGGAHPLQDIVMGWHSPSDNLTVMEVLGADKSRLFNSNYQCPTSPSFCGYQNISRKYDIVNGWTKVASTDQSNTLNNWYSSFLNETGKWTEMSRRCNSLGRDRNAKITSLGPLKDLCYQNSSFVSKI